MTYELPTLDEFRAAHAELAAPKVPVAILPKPAPQPTSAKDRFALAQYPLATRWGWVR